VSVSSEVNYAFKMLQYMRTGARINSRVRVLLEWSEAGNMHTAEGYTVDISPKGCLAIAPQGIAVGQALKLRNVSNHKESDATLIWRGHEGRTGWELGLELVHPPADFWGVEF
jgi:PilZ domain